MNSKIMASQTNDNWSLIIKPKKNLLEIDFKQIWEFRDLLILFIRRDIVTKYKQTILGPLWFIIQPILTTLMYLLVFGRIANIPTDNVPPILFYLSGIVAWTYFSVCLNSTASTFITNAGIFGKVHFPRLVVPLSIVISNIIQFLIQLGLLLIAIGIYYFKGVSFTFTYNLFLLPFLILLMALLGLGFGIIISSLTTKYRDLSNLMGFGIQLWMYATPIIYPLSVIPDKYKIFILANPLTAIIITFKSALLGTQSVSYGYLIYSSVFTLVILFFGIIIFNRVERSFMDTV
jgi:lipopolysaccharide transport system permease protein